MSINVRCVAVVEEKEDAETSGRYDPKQDKLINSCAELDRGELSKLGRLSLAVAQALRLVDVRSDGCPY